MKAVRESARAGDRPELASDGANVRRSERRAYVHFTWFQCIDPVEDDAARGIGRACDVAEGGLGFVATHELQPGCRLFLVLVAPVGRVSAVGTVMHCRAEPGGQFRIGVRVDLVPPIDQPTWATLSRSDPT